MRSRARMASAVFLVLALCYAACDDETPTKPGNGDPCDTTQGPCDTTVTPTYTYELEPVFTALSFFRPTDIRNAGDGSGRLFVCEQDGAIITFDSAATTSTSHVFLDIKARVYAVNPIGETGLLGLAFHPDYESNGYFFVYYTYAASPTQWFTRLSRFSVSAGDSNAADPNSERVLLTIPQFALNHNGGGIAFGEGSELFVSVGDGGGGGDPQNNGQNPRNLLGTIVRIDVDISPDVAPYHGIPSDNPFFGSATFAEEVYAYGLRNPWRISYDALTQRLWAGDVGQGNWEEVDVIENGYNYGWDCREGPNPYVPPSPACTLGTYAQPVWWYPHNAMQRSITGGYVYRGPRAPSLTGKYIVGEYITGEIWALTLSGATATAINVFDAPFNITTFGTGEDGEVYVAEYRVPGKLHRIVEVEVLPAP